MLSHMGSPEAHNILIRFLRIAASSFDRSVPCNDSEEDDVGVVRLCRCTISASTARGSF